MPLDDLCPSRRTLLRGLAALGGATLAPGVLVACGATSGPATDPGAEGGGATSDPAAAPSSAAPPSAAGGSVPVGEVPVGTARVVDLGDRRVVVAQVSEGEFRAFSANCTHQGTVVNADEGALTLTCPNHGSRFDAGDGGAVLQGPATEPLPELEVTVEGDSLLVA
jgi:Rieske Fe-S protein